MTNQTIAKKRILITGAGHGFGKEAALGLARAGHSVVAAAQIWPQVWDLRHEATAKGLTLDVIKLDVTDKIDREHALRHEIDVLVNNGGVMETGAMVDIPLERIRATFEVNVFAHLELTQGFLRQMIARKQGKIVWVSSMGGLLDVPFAGAYTASKHAVESICAVMREEVKAFGVKVATINPGAFRTGFNDTGTESMHQWFDRSRNLVEPPDFAAALAEPTAQFDQQIMIDKMVELIPADDHAYRTVWPQATEAAVKEYQAGQWTLAI